MTLQVVQGVEGLSIYLNDYRIAGAKPWGGGRIVRTFDIRQQDVISAMREKRRE